jgi:hypothetical protein
MMSFTSTRQRRQGLVRILLVVLIVVDSPGFCQALRRLPLPVSLVAPPIIYSIYSTLVKAYAKRVVKRMDAVPSPFQLAEQLEALPEAPTSVQELRKTVSKASHLVERPKHRLLWNQWAAHFLQQQPLDRKDNNYSFDHLLGNYTFAYRSYVDQEEQYSICKALRSWHTFVTPFMSRGHTQLFFYSNNDTHIKATMTDYFWQKGVLFSAPITISWFGHVNMAKWPPTIEWTSTEFVTGRPGTKTYQVISNPPASEKLRGIPWDILQYDNGMILFRRGTVGVLAFDRNP